MPICSGMRRASIWQMPVRTRVPSSSTSGTRTSSTRCATPNCRPSASRIFGRTDAMVENLLFDKLAYIDRLTKAGVDKAQARAHAEALEEALRESVAPRSDVLALRHEIQLAVRDIKI